MTKNKNGRHYMYIWFVEAQVCLFSGGAVNIHFYRSKLIRIINNSSFDACSTTGMNRRMIHVVSLKDWDVSYWSPDCTAASSRPPILSDK